MKRGRKGGSSVVDKRTDRRCPLGACRRRARRDGTGGGEEGRRGGLREEEEGKKQERRVELEVIKNPSCSNGLTRAGMIAS